MKQVETHVHPGIKGCTLSGCELEAEDKIGPFDCIPGSSCWEPVPGSMVGRRRTAPLTMKVVRPALAAVT